MVNNHLVGGWPTPLKNMSSSVGMIIPNIYIYICGKIKNVPNHQPVMVKPEPGWWCNNHLEKYEFVNGKDDIPYIMEKLKCLKPPTRNHMEKILSVRLGAWSWGQAPRVSLLASRLPDPSAGAGASACPVLTNLTRKKRERSGHLTMSWLYIYILLYILYTSKNASHGSIFVGGCCVYNRKKWVFLRNDSGVPLPQSAPGQKKIIASRKMSPIFMVNTRPEDSGLIDA